MCYDIKDLQISKEKERDAILNFLQTAGVSIEDIKDASFEELVELVDGILAVAKTEDKGEELPMSEYFPELRTVKYEQESLEMLPKEEKVEYIQPGLEEIFKFKSANPSKFKTSRKRTVLQIEKKENKARVSI